jgi:hypothetical protein
VDIDLLPLVNMVLRQLSGALPTLFGHEIRLPDLSSGQVPANLRSTIENALGVTVPANVTQFTVYDRGRLRALQVALVQARRDLVMLVGGTLLLLVSAFLVSPWRRRTALQLGLWLVVASVLATAGLRALRGQLLAQVPEGTYRDGTQAAITIVTTTVRQRGVQLIWLGFLLAAGAYLIGPGRFPRWLRSGLGTAGRRTIVAARSAGRHTVRYGPGLVARHRDAVRVAGVVVAALVVLLLSSWLSLLVMTVALVGYQLSVTAVVRAGRAGSSAVDEAGGAVHR